MGTPLDLDRFYSEHAQALFAFLLNFTRNETDTRDLLQEVFIKLARRPELLDGIREPRAFVLRLAHNLAVDQVRRRAALQKSHDQCAEQFFDLFAPTADPDESAFREALQQGLGGLAPEQRAVVHLKLWEGLTFEQIAELLQIPANTAASRYRYALDKLRLHLRPIYEEIK